MRYQILKINEESLRLPFELQMEREKEELSHQHGMNIRKI